MAKRILVTGGTGFIGQAIVTALVRRGDSVRTFDNGWRVETNRPSGVDGAERIQGDIRDPHQVAHAMAGMSSVCHLAAINGTKNFYERPGLVLDVGVRGMLNVLDAAKAHSVGEIFLMSSSEAYQTPQVIPTDERTPLVVPDPLNPRYSYGASKLISEMLVLHSGIGTRTCIVRPHNVYGPAMGEDHVIPEFIRRMNLSQEEIRFPIQGDGSETRAFCFIDDFVNGFLAVFDRGENRNIYHLGGAEETRISDLAQLVALTLGKRVEIIPGPRAEGGTIRRCPDISKASGLGFVPQWSLRDGLKRTVEWYLKKENP